MVQTVAGAQGLTPNLNTKLNVKDLLKKLKEVPKFTVGKNDYGSTLNNLMKVAKLQQEKIENLQDKVESFEAQAIFHSKPPMVNPDDKQQIDFLQTVCRKIGEFDDQEPIEHAYEFDSWKIANFLNDNSEESNSNSEEKINYVIEAMRNLILYKCKGAEALRSRRVLNDKDIEEFGKACLNEKTLISVDFNKENFRSGSFIRYGMKDKSRLHVYGPALINSVNDKSIFAVATHINKGSSIRNLEIIGNKIASILRGGEEHDKPICNVLNAFPENSQR